ncbi:carbohydrate ABC transporter permease [Acidisphaera sp. L21]|uniref:carbohydrate ABC transporter permease n=1 Tax=Acidisphaera sp. L21 TaxID=1641851 RepID=UPI00131BA37E|nr:carbohydrate ABC transporter permease [Acidisphaera sp. L21]
MPASRIPTLIALPAAVLWAVPFLWMLVASLRPGYAPDIASLLPHGPFGADNIVEAWQDGSFPIWYLNTILLCGGILVVQFVTISMAGYAFARLHFRGERLVFAAFLLQLLLVPTLLIVPNLTTLSALGLYDTLTGVAAPYLASAFGVFLMRQTFRAIPRDYEEAAMLDGASRRQVITSILLPMARPGLLAFAIVSVTSHWNEFLWPLMVISSPSHQVLTVGLASFASGSEAGGTWGVLAAGTLLVAGPLLLGFVAFQRQFTQSFVFTGIK